MLSHTVSRGAANQAYLAFQAWVHPGNTSIMARASSRLHHRVVHLALHRLRPWAHERMYLKTRTLIRL